MCERYILKNNAKEALKRFYWHGVLAALIYFILVGGGTGVSSSISNMNRLDRINNTSGGYGVNYTSYINPMLFSLLLFLILFVFVIAMFYLTFVSNIISVGYVGFFLKSRERATKEGEIFSYFKKGIYLNLVKGMFFYNLYILLWSLLFVIPGIIKAYEYTFVPSILADNPTMDHKRAFEISRQMTDGEKFNIFVLDLSFFWWNCLAVILSIFTCGLGYCFVAPYISATRAELYTYMKTRALEDRITTLDELPGFTPEWQKQAL